MSFGSPPSVELRFKSDHGLTVEICLGDVTEANADGIVVPEGTSFQHTGFVAQRLIEIDHKYANIRKELVKKNGVKKNGSFKVWEVYTKRFGKRFKYVICGIVPPCSEDVDAWKSKLMLLYQRIFLEAERKVMSVLAVPLLGSGRGGGSLDDAIEVAMVSAAKVKGSSFNTVMFVSNDWEVCTLMMRACGCKKQERPHSGTSRPGSDKQRAARYDWRVSDRDGATGGCRGRGRKKDSSCRELFTSFESASLLPSLPKSRSIETDIFVPKNTRQNNDGGEKVVVPRFATGKRHHPRVFNDQNEFRLISKEKSPGRFVVPPFQHDSSKRHIVSDVDEQDGPKRNSVEHMIDKGYQGTDTRMHHVGKHENEMTLARAKGKEGRHEDLERKETQRSKNMNKDLERLNKGEHSDDSEQWQQKNIKESLYSHMVQESGSKYNNTKTEEYSINDQGVDYQPTKDRTPIYHDARDEMYDDEREHGDIDDGDEIRYLLSIMRKDIENQLQPDSKVDMDCVKALAEKCSSRSAGKCVSEPSTQKILAKQNKGQMVNHPEQSLSVKSLKNDDDTKPSDSNVDNSERCIVNQGVAHIRRDPAYRGAEKAKESDKNIIPPELGFEKIHDERKHVDTRYLWSMTRRDTDNQLQDESKVDMDCVTASNEKGEVSFSASWTQMKSGTQLISLSRESHEYKDVEHSFMASKGPQLRTVQEIQRVQSTTLWQSYCLRKQELESRDPSVQNERVLWHGTTRESVQSICKNGFNRSFSGKNAAQYGDGVYFARDCSYAADDTYSIPDTDGSKYVFRSRVLTGTYTKGEKGMRHPPWRDQEQHLMYDSLVNNVDRPELYVVFHDAQAYPEYLVKFI